MIFTFRNLLHLDQVNDVAEASYKGDRRIGKGYLKKKKEDYT